MSRRELDDAVDRAVRDMMSAEPRPGFRGRVLARIARPRRTWFTLPRLAGAMVGAAALIAFVQWQRSPEHPADPPPVVQSSRSTAAPPATGAAPAPYRRGAPDPVTEMPIPRSLRSRTRVVQATSVTIDEDEMALAPLDAVTPLAIAAIAEAQLVTREISIGALRVAPLNLEPLPPAGAEGNPREDR